MAKSIGAFRLKEKNLQGAGTSSAGTNTEQTLTFVDILLTDNTDYDYVFLFMEGFLFTRDNVLKSIIKFIHTLKLNN